MIASSSTPMNRTDRLGSYSSGMPVWCRPTTPRFAPPPAGPRSPADLRRLRVDAAVGALAAERGDGPRMGEEESGVLPHAGQQFVHVVGGRRAGPGVQPLGEIGVAQQADVGVVDELIFLAFAQGLDGQAELVLDLVHRVVVQVGDPGV